MKKAVFFIALAVVAVSAVAYLTINRPGDSDLRKAERAVAEYLRENLHDPGSYEPAEFGTLDSSFAADGSFAGWTIYHRFRASNAMGAKVAEGYVFTLSPDLEKVRQAD